MAFQLSPGVNVSEVDLTTVVPSVATTVGGFAGNFNWGPVDEIVTINNEVQLVERFGKPNSNTYTSFFTAANFLSYANDIRVVRSVGSTANNATVDAAGISIKNKTDYEEQFPIAENVFDAGSYPRVFAAKYPGALGNALRVSMCDANTTILSTWTYRDEFSANASNSAFAVTKGISKDEIHIVVVDRTGAISGTEGTVLEKFGFASKLKDAKNEDGTSNYYVDVLNSRSKYIWWLSHPIVTTNWGRTSSNLLDDSNFISANKQLDALTSTTFDLSGGTDVEPTAGNRNSSYDLFDNPDSVDVSLLMTGETVGDTIPDHLISMAENRKDVLVFISPEQSDCVNNSGSEVTDIRTLRDTITSSSFAVMDSGWKYQYDKYNDVYRWIPLNGDVAGLCARTDIERDPWFSPAGFNRGQIKNVVKLAWNPTKAERDSLYKMGINPVVTFPGEGTVLYGDKTLLSRPSAFDRINVRRLFIVLEKAIARASRSSLFEFNDEFTRAQFVNLVEPFLRDVQGRRGIYDYRVVCDTTNNTPEVIDRNEFVGDIYIKPARSINFIQLNFVAVRTGVSFNEVVGSF
jgi:phage tail sheath protein FI